MSLSIGTLHVGQSNLKILEQRKKEIKSNIVLKQITIECHSPFYLLISYFSIYKYSSRIAFSDRVNCLPCENLKDLMESAVISHFHHKRLHRLNTRSLIQLTLYLSLFLPSHQGKLSINCVHIPIPLDLASTLNRCYMTVP